MVLRLLQLVLALGPLVLPLVAYCCCIYFTSTVTLVVNVLRGDILEYFNLNNWAKYVDRINKQDQG